MRKPKRPRPGRPRVDILENLYDTMMFNNVGQLTAQKTCDFIVRRIGRYSEKLNLEFDQILKNCERLRNHSAPSFYQNHNYPHPDDVRIYENHEQFAMEIHDQKFRCPACGEITNLPKHCTHCDFISYGYLKTMNKGFRFTIKNQFLEKPIIEEIFMPVCLEKHY